MHEINKQLQRKEDQQRQFKRNLSNMLIEWENLKALWKKSKIEKSPLLSDETTKNIEQSENALIHTLVKLLNANDDERDFLYESARNIRDEKVGRKIQIRGAIEASNICRENCLYCSMRRENSQKAQLFRLSSDQIIKQVKLAYVAGIKEIFIQSGEDSGMISTAKDVLRTIKSNPKLKELHIILNLGSHTKKDYYELAKAGACGYLIKHEISDASLHKKLRPSTTLQKRTKALLEAREAGMYIGTGNIIGLPCQTDEMLAKDIIFAGRLGSGEMVSCSPFTPSENTPLKNYPSGNFWKTLNMIAIYRHLFPHSRIPSVSNLDNPKLSTRPSDLKITGQSAGINAGANGITINLTPSEIQKKYEIYGAKNKRCIVNFSKAEKISAETGLPLDIHQ